MQTKSRNEPAGSPIPGVIPAPTGVEHGAGEADGAPAERSGVMIPNRRKRLPLEAPLMRLVASAGIVAIGVVIAAIMTSQGSAGWLIGLVVSIVSLVLAAVLWSSRRL